LVEKCEVGIFFSIGESDKFARNLKKMAGGNKSVTNPFIM
jgi:hypothetical protein